MFKVEILGFTECEIGWSSYQWKVVAGSTDPWVDIRPVYVDECRCGEIEWGSRIFGHNEYCLSVVPQYSTEIRYAWTITEHFPLFSLLKRGDYWMAITDMSDARAKSAPLAICLAALGG